MRARRASGSVSLLALALALARPARAQHCEPPPAADSELFRIGARAEAARYESGADQGHYEGFVLGGALGVGLLRVRASLPYYRLLEPEGHADGLGDLESKLEIAVVERDGWTFGGAFAASLPTGSAEKRLGMGHVMLGPSVWLSRSAARFFTSAELGYMGALSAEGDASSEMSAHEHHHHHGSSTSARHANGGPIPNPMNPNEAWLGIAAGYGQSSLFAVSGGGTLAVPTTDEGETRATVRAAVDFELGGPTTSLGVEVDLFGATRRTLGYASADVRF